MNIFTTLKQVRGNVTMWPWIVYTLNSLQSWRIVVQLPNTDVEKMLWIWCCGYNVVSNSLHFKLFAKLMHRWCNFLIPTLRRCCEFDVAVTTLFQDWNYIIHDTLWGGFFIQCWGKLIESYDLTLQCRRYEDAVNLTSQFQLCRNVVNTIFIERHELKLLSNVEEKLKQRCNSDVVVWMSLQCCVFVVQRCDFTKTLLQSCVFVEAVGQRCSVKKAFLEISQNSQENTCARVSFLLKLQASGLQLY